MSNAQGVVELLRRAGRVLVATAVVAAGAACASPGGEGGEPVAAAATSSAVPATSSAVPAIGGAVAATTATQPVGVADVQPGSCVVLIGVGRDDATANPVDCADPAATHVVLEKTKSQAECSGDADARYFETRRAADVFALCLDLNWRPGACFDLTDQQGDTPRVPCQPTPGRDIQQYESTVQATTEPDGCSQAGFPYPDRNFIVCTVAV